MDLDHVDLLNDPPPTEDGIGTKALPSSQVGPAARGTKEDACSDISEDMVKMLEEMRDGCDFPVLRSGQDVVARVDDPPLLTEVIEMPEDRMEKALRLGHSLAPFLLWLSLEERLLEEFPECPAKLVRAFWKGLRHPQRLNHQQRVRPSGVPEAVLIEDDVIVID